MRGGYRAGAGRPRGAKTVREVVPPATDTGGERMTPLQYLLQVLNDPSADEARRDRAAIALLPYSAPRHAPLTGKEAREAGADAREDGNGWAELVPALYRPRRVKAYGTD